MASATEPPVKIHSRRPRGRPKVEDIAALEERILLVAFQTFVEHGYGGSSINEIARRARISKPTLYARFPSKAVLFRAIIKNQISKYNSLDQPPLPGDQATLEDRLKTYMHVALTDGLNGDIFHSTRLILAESNRFPELAQAADERYRVGEWKITRLLKEYAARDNIKCHDPEGAAAILNVIVTGWYISAMVGNRSISSAELEDFVEKTIKKFMAALPLW